MLMVNDCGRAAEGRLSQYAEVIPFRTASTEWPAACELAVAVHPSGTKTGASGMSAEAPAMTMSDIPRLPE
jgi:hypothetical protein